LTGSSDRRRRKYRETDGEESHRETLANDDIRQMLTNESMHSCGMIRCRGHSGMELSWPEALGAEPRADSISSAALCC
jgi:hypothetical protein